MFKQLTKRKCALLIIVLIVAVLITIIYIVNRAPYTPFLEQVAKTNPELIDYSSQSVTTEDYTITLEKTMYDQETGIGYLAYAITKADGKPEATLNKWHQASGNCFGENNRFHIDINGSNSITFRYVGKTLYEYIFYQLADSEAMELCLVDYENSNRYDFTVKDSIDSFDTVVNSNTIITISELGIAIHSTSPIETISISLHYEDDREEQVVDTEQKIGTGNSGEHVSDNSNYEYSFVFEDVKRIDEIDYIIFNGQKY